MSAWLRRMAAEQAARDAKVRAFLEQMAEQEGDDLVTAALIGREYHLYPEPEDIP
jgi:hypothetical protein